METNSQTSSHEERSCLCKAKYFKKKAKDTAKAMRRKFGEKNIKAYNCLYCPYWHVGHTPKDKSE